MIDFIKEKFFIFIDILLGRKNEDDGAAHDTNTKNDNSKVKTRQVKLLIVILLGMAGTLLAVISIVQERKKTVAKEEIDPTIKIEVAADSVEADKLWPNRIEEEQRKLKIYFDEKLKALENSFQDKEKLILDENKAELDKMKAQLEFAKADLNRASIELERVGQMREQNTPVTPKAQGSSLSNTSFATDREFDRPKSINDYIPEGTYVIGRTLTGLAVSTGLNAPTENATPVVIRLTGNGNLSERFKVDMSKCQILGSSYGDLSSERAHIRLEKLTCTDNTKGLITTTDIAGFIQGPDGKDGIKGKIVATSSRYIRNALTGGIISGLASSAKGQDSATVTSAGVVNTKKKGFGRLAGEGVLTGTSNAADKVADYYLRQAEAMSPVLEIDAGIWVHAFITKGVYFGELGVRKKIKELRTENENKEEVKKQQQTNWINQNDLH